MAFPQVAGTAKWNCGSSKVTTADAALPSNISAGDILIVILGFANPDGGNPSTPSTPSGWALAIGGTYTGSPYQGGYVYWKIATGSEGSSVSIAINGNNYAATYAYRITGGIGVQAQWPEEMQHDTTMYPHTNGYPVYPAWGTQDTLWIAALATGTGANNPPTFSWYDAPTGYGNFDYSVSSGGLWPGVMVARKESNASNDGGTVYWSVQYGPYYPESTFQIAVCPTPPSTDPTPAGIAKGQSSASTTSHTVPLPGGITAGERLVVFGALEPYQNDVVNTPSGWTKTTTWTNSDNILMTSVVLTKIASGSEGTSLSLSTSSSVKMTFIAYRIRNGDQVFASSVGRAGDSTPNPPSLSPGSTQKFLWMAYAETNLSEAAFSYPANYARGAARTNGGTQLSSMSATRLLNASSEDPGTFTIPTSAYWISGTLAIAPKVELTGVGAIASGEAFGTVELVYNREIVGVGGIASAETFGGTQVLAIKGATFPAISAFTGTHAWSVAAWAKWTSKTAGRVFSVWDTNGNELASLKVDNSASSANRAAHTVSGAANDGYYHLYVMTYDGVSLRFYIDGRAAGAEVASSTSLAAAAGMRAGSGYGGASPFGGSIDDVAVWDYYLSASQVAGLYVSGTTSGVDLVHDSSGSSMILAGWLPHAYPAGYDAGSTISVGFTDLPANGGSIAFPIPVAGKMALRQVSIWNFNTTLARSWNWALYYQPRQDAISNTLFRVAVGTADDSFTASAASKRSIVAAGAPTLLGPGVYWLLIQNTHSTNAFTVGGVASGSLSIDRAQTKTLSVPVGSTLDFTAATWTKQTGIGAVVLEGDVLGLWGAF